MIITDIIKKLEKIRREYGDINVKIADISDREVYDIYYVEETQGKRKSKIKYVLIH
jgi:hypothetical protein